jgi:hypothetical protein
MEYSGLISKYKVNRPLTEEERADQLKPKKRNDVTPHYNLSTIKTNSTYLEIVDKFYAWKGMISLVSLIFITIFGGGYVALLLLAIDRWHEPGHQDGLALILMAGMWLPFIGFMFWNLFREFDTYTHYPIRLNRKNRMVFVFRRNGTVMSASWDDLFFTFDKGSFDPVLRAVNWNIRGHLLDADGVTIKETFAFPIYSTKKDELLNYWEFVRRYMEEGPAKLIGSDDGQVEICHPIADRKESFGWSMQLIYSHMAMVPVMFWIFSPFLTLIGLARYLANLTCDVPVWPKSVESACAIEPGDPYERDYRNNPKNLRRFA